jgi:antitoxin (DNA-binding transcriptional repressor) of toxin-antitoxin stability system
MIKTSVAEVKAKLSEYLDRALAGERIVICRHNKPIVELRALDEGRGEPRPVGRLPGRPTFEVAASFFEPLPEEELDAWDGGGVVAALPGRERGAQPARVAETRPAFRNSSARTRRRRRS